MEFGLVIGCDGRFVARRRKGSLTFESFDGPLWRLRSGFLVWRWGGPLGLEWAGDLHVIAIDAVEAYYLVFWGNTDGYVEVGYVGGLAQ
jgi:hypothetical protein